MILPNFLIQFLPVYIWSDIYLYLRAFSMCRFFFCVLYKLCKRPQIWFLCEILLTSLLLGFYDQTDVTVVFHLSDYHIPVFHNNSVNSACKVLKVFFSFNKSLSPFFHICSWYKHTDLNNEIRHLFLHKCSPLNFVICVSCSW